MSNEKPAYLDLQKKINQLELKLYEYQLIADYSVNWEVLRDPTGKLIYSSPAFERITGYSNEDFMAGKVTTKDIVHPDDYQYVTEKMKQAREGKPVSPFENRFITKKKEIRHSVTEIRPIWHGDNFIGFRVTLRDISDRVETVQALKESEEKYKNLFNNSEVGMYQIRLDGSEILELNEKYCKILNYTADEVKGMPSVDFWVDKKERENMVKLLKANGRLSNYEYSVYNKQKKVLRCLTSLVLYPETGIIEGTVIDITDRKNAEDELKKAKEKAEENEKLLMDVMNGSSSFIYMFDTEGKYIHLNDQMASYFGKKRSELIGKTREGLMPEEIIEQHLQNDKKVIETGKTLSFEEETIEKDGKHYYFTTKYPLINKENKIYGVAGFSTDITDKKHIETELIKAKEKAEENEFFLRKSQAAGNVGSYKTDFKAGFWKSSETLDRIFGIDKEYDRSVEGWLSIVHPDDRQMMNDYLVEEVIKNKKTFAREYRIVRINDKQVRWVFGYGDVSFDEDDNLVEMIGTIQDITEQKTNEIELIKAKEKVENSEKQLRAVFENLKDGIGISKKGIHVFTNSKYANLFGFDNQEEIIGKSVLGQVAPDERKRIQEYVKKRANGSDVPSFYETIGLRKNGEEFPIEVSVGSYELNDETYTVTIVRDISERKAAEKILAQFMFAIESTSDAIGISDTQGVHFYQNKAMSDLFGYKDPEELQSIGGGAATVKDPLVAKEIFENIKNGKPWIGELEMVKKDGTVFYAFERADAIKDEEGNILGLIGIVSDITEKKQVEQDLIAAKEKAEENEDKYKLLYNNTPVMMQSADMEGNLISVNDYWLQFFGYQYNEVIGTKTIAYLTEESKKLYKTKIEEFIQNGVINNIEAQAIKKNGEIVDLLVSSKISLDNKGKPVQTMTNLIDITEKKQVEQELIEAKEKAEESDRLKTAFLQNMSHEIRTPLNAIMGFSSLFLRNLDNPEKLELFSNIIETRSNDLLDIINDILDISKIEAGSFTVAKEECKPNELFNELSLIFREQQIRTNKEHISLLFEIDNNLNSRSIITDKGKLKQILVNLISNALKFTEEGYVKSSCRLEDNKVLFIISDTGIGIPPDKLTYIFERFVQLNSLPRQNLGGTGLGLPIVKGLVNLLGGSIWVNSEINKGSEFKFTIESEIIAPKIIPKESKPETLIIPGQQKTILIVEDDLYNMEYIKEVLSGFNFNIICAITAHDAIELAIEQSIDLILMDIQLPDLNGHEATKTILASKPKIKIIAQTAYADIEEKNKAIKMGCVDFINKPIKKDNLIKIVQKNL